MAILTARSLDGLLQESVGFLDDEQLLRLTERLNQADGDALSAEWELIVLTALSYCGVVEHEPKCTGSRKLDFGFSQPATGIKIVGDITAPSDDEVQKNSVGFLSLELNRLLEKYGIRGQTLVSVVGEALKDRSVRPCLPDPHEFKRYVFNAEFQGFIKKVLADPGRTHILSIENARAKLSIQLSPGQWTQTMTYRNFKMPRDIINNVVHHAVKRKHDQIKDSGHAEGDGWRWVVLCDGGCDALTGRNDWASYSASDVITQYLRRHRSLDIVVSVSVQTSSRPVPDLEFSVEVFDGPNSRVAGTVRQLFSAGLARIPPPVRSPVNAKYYLQRRSATDVVLDGRAGTSYGGHQFTFSSRALFDYLAARIDRVTFERLVNPHPLEILRRRLDEGSLPVEVQLVRNSDQDDDAVTVRLGEPDPAVSRFVPRFRSIGESETR